MNNALPPRARDTLLLCRTPFQAVVLRRVIKDEDVGNYDLVYFTQNDAEEDRHYFKELSVSANRVQYVYIRPQKFDIANHIMFYLAVSKEIRRKKYGAVILSSFDNIAIRRLSTKYDFSEIITFDEGSGYINKYSEYIMAKNPVREAVYAFSFAGCARTEFIARVARHYSIYRGLENIMPQKIVRYIDLFPSGEKSEPYQPAISLFIGQPFDEYHDCDYIKNLKRYILNLSIDYYVKHPREKAPLVGCIPLLSKGGRIAEDAIFEMSKGRRLVIFGAFSTVLLNVGSEVAEKVMILRRGVEQDHYLAELGKRTGCRIVFV